MKNCLLSLILWPCLLNAQGNQPVYPVVTPAYLKAISEDTGVFRNDSSISVFKLTPKLPYIPNIKEIRNSHPYILEVNYTTDLPSNSEKAELALQTKLDRWKAKVGETVRLTVEVTNKRAGRQPMALTKIGIPAGLNFQHWQLKELMDKNQVSYYELFDNYLVLYWTEMDANEKKTIHLDLKADVPGTYKGRASNVYLYYTPEDQHWNEGMEVTIEDN